MHHNTPKLWMEQVMAPWMPSLRLHHSGVLNQLNDHLGESQINLLFYERVFVSRMVSDGLEHNRCKVC